MDFGGFLMPVFVLVVMLSRLLQVTVFVVSRFALVPTVSSIVVLIGVRTGNPGPRFAAVMIGRIGMSIMACLMVMRWVFVPFSNRRRFRAIRGSRGYGKGRMQRQDKQKWREARTHTRSPHDWARNKHAEALRARR
jgi:hypothetical protein